MSDLLIHALEYARRGWSILAIGQNKKPPPRQRWKRYQTQRASESTLRRWFEKNGVTGLAGKLGAFVATLAPAAQVFKMPEGKYLPRMLRADLAAARSAWVDEAKADGKEQARREQSSFLDYRDDVERVADFHALRHTFITNLAASGVHPKTAQTLARHSDIGLTMNRYSHTYREQEVDALASLPDLSRPSRQAARATGTDDARAGEKNLADYLAPNEQRGAISVGAGGRSHPVCDERADSEKSLINKGKTRRTRGEKQLRPAGLEPATPGLGNRCSIH